MYDTAMVARLTKLSADRIRRWLRGYQYQVDNGMGDKIVVKQKPLVERDGTTGTIYASFLDVIDLLFIKEFLNQNFSIQTLRKAFNEAKKITNRHHFAQSIFFTKGEKIFMKVKDKQEGLVELFTNGQWVIEPFITQYAKRIDFDAVTKYALRWRPLKDNDDIVLDPRRSFGSPVIASRGITTSTVYDLYLAESKSVDAVAKWFDLKESEVRSAVKFEQWLTKKAA